MQSRSVVVVIDFHDSRGRISATFESKTHILLLHRCESRLQLLTAFFHGLKSDQQRVVRPKDVVRVPRRIIHRAIRSVRLQRQRVSLNLVTRTDTYFARRLDFVLESLIPVLSDVISP